MPAPSQRFKRKSTAQIEAVQLTPELRKDFSQWPEWMYEAWCMPMGDVGSVYPVNYPRSKGDDPLVCVAKEGSQNACFGDWIIRNTAGDIYPCNQETFEAIYEAVDEPVSVSV